MDSTGPKSAIQLPPVVVEGSTGKSGITPPPSRILRSMSRAREDRRRTNPCRPQPSPPPARRDGRWSRSRSRGLEACRSSLPHYASAHRLFKRPDGICLPAILLLQSRVLPVPRERVTHTSGRTSHPFARDTPGLENPAGVSATSPEAIEPRMGFQRSAPTHSSRFIPGSLRKNPLKPIPRQRTKKPGLPRGRPGP